MTSARPSSWRPEIHQLGDRAAVADELHHLRADQRHRLGIIQAQAAREPLLREIARLMQRELVELVRCQMHEVTISYSRDRRRGAATGNARRRAQRAAHRFDARAGHAQQRSAVRKRCGGDDEIGAACDWRV